MQANAQHGRQNQVKDILNAGYEASQPVMRMAPEQLPAAGARRVRNE